MINKNNILNLCGFISPRAAMSIIPKITRSKHEQDILGNYVDKAVRNINKKRTKQNEI